MDRRLIILLMALMGVVCTYAQEVIPTVDGLVRTDSISVFPPDTLVADSLVTDSLALDSIPKKKSALDAVVLYEAKDSIVMTGTNWAYLFGEGNVKYQNIDLTSEIIEISMDSNIVVAKYGLDSIGQEFGYPVFKQGDQQYESKVMRYNFKTTKGYITDVITKQGEGYVTASKTKKMPDDVLNMMNGKYTTCDLHDEPHFYIQMTKAKIRPGKNIVTGPVYLVVEDVPLPLALPFAFFPFSDKYSSGILMPTFGDQSTLGYFLREGGYYFALSDYIDLALTGEIYTKGSWGVTARSNYRKRYKYSGNFNVSYLVTKEGDKIPNLRAGQKSDYSLSKDFKLQWSHSQDAKANPFLSFSASVNFATSSYDRNSMNSLYNGAISQNTKGSSVNITKRFPNSPFSLSGTATVNQVTRDSSISVSFPDLSITMNRIYPFKRKNAIGSERWYEKISMSYTGYFRNSIQTKDSLIMKSNIIKDWKNSMEHKIPLSATFSLFNYINITPSVNYNERWYTSKIEQTYNTLTQRMMPSDTTYSFYRIYDYNAAISASTSIYGFFKPLPFLGKKVEMIRHRFEPSVSFSATPDFGTSRYGYWEHYSYMDEYGEMRMLTYSPFSHQGSIPGGSGKSGSVSFSVNNNVEMKIKSDKDSTGVRKISLIDNLSLATSYNLAADSMNWSDLSVGLRLKLSKSYTFNMNGTFDTYTYNTDSRGNPVRVNVPRWNAGKGIGRLRATSTSFSYTFNNDTFKKLLGGKEKDPKSGTTPDPNSPLAPPDPLNPQGLEDPSAAETSGGSLRQKKEEKGEYDSNGYLLAEVPWSLSFSYGLQVGYGSFDAARLEYKYRFTNSLSFNGNIQPTKNWRINFNAAYDFDANRLSSLVLNLTRNMHCFQMTANIIPVGMYKSYSFSISVSSSLLKDLKYDKSSNYRDGQSWY